MSITFEHVSSIITQNLHYRNRLRGERIIMYCYSPESKRIWGHRFNDPFAASICTKYQAQQKGIPFRGNCYHPRLKRGCVHLRPDGAERIANTVTKRDGIRHEICAFPHIELRFLIWYNFCKQCNPVQDCQKREIPPRDGTSRFTCWGAFPKPHKSKISSSAARLSALNSAKRTSHEMTAIR